MPGTGAPPVASVSLKQTQKLNMSITRLDGYNKYGLLDSKRRQRLLCFIRLSSKLSKLECLMLSIEKCDKIRQTPQPLSYG